MAASEARGFTRGIQRRKALRRQVRRCRAFPPSHGWRASTGGDARVRHERSERLATAPLQSGDRADRLVEHFEDEVRIRFCDTHRGSEANRLAPKSAFAEKEA